MKARRGHRDDVVALLLDGVEGLRAAGCHAYIVSAVPGEDEDTIHVTEVWESKEHHAASLRLPDVKASIAKAMPMLTGEFDMQELEVVGRLGLGPPPGGHPSP